MSGMSGTKFESPDVELTKSAAIDYDSSIQEEEEGI